MTRCLLLYRCCSSGRNDFSRFAHQLAAPEDNTQCLKRLKRLRFCWVAAGLARETANLERLSMMHVYGDPLKYRDLESKISVERFNSAIILCDAAWVDPDQVPVII